MEMDCLFILLLPFYSVSLSLSLLFCVFALCFENDFKKN